MKSRLSSKTKPFFCRPRSLVSAAILATVPGAIWAEEILFSDDFESAPGKLENRPGWLNRGLPLEAFRVEEGEMVALPPTDNQDHGVALGNLALDERFEIQFDLRVAAAPNREGDYVLALSTAQGQVPWVAKLEVRMVDSGFQLALEERLPEDGTKPALGVGQTIFPLGEVVRVRLRYDRSASTVTLIAGSPDAEPVETITLIEPALKNPRLDTPLFLRRKTWDGTGSHSIDNVKVVIPND